MCSFCLLTSMELILVPNSSLLYLHSNNMNSLTILYLKKKESFSYKYIQGLFQPSRQFLEALRPKKVGQTPMLTGKYSESLHF